MCIFCQIAKKKIPAEIVYEDEKVLAFKDIHPIAPVHVLVITKEHVESVNELVDEQLAGRLILVGKRVAQDLAISEKGYKLLFRVGADGGQEVSHIHLHVLGGAKLYEEIRAE
ncbi:histidine triad nucleotide-binding protein [Patescibacteria group bacterium]|nr:MAG: histidine triad nucleotide-binding protein [Patescibacteria group bacterium]